VDVDDLAVGHDRRRNVGHGCALDRPVPRASLYRGHETGFDIEANWSIPWPASHGHDPLIGHGAFEVEVVQR
jgi:hypothetical protein